MSMPAAQQPDIPRSPATLLAEAAGRLSERLRTLPASGTIAPETAVDETATLLSCVLAILDGAEVQSAATPLCRPALHTQLAHALRREVLALTSERDDPAPTLAVVRALEQTIEAVSGEDAEDLRTRLGNPDAFELLIEVAHDLRSPLTSILFLSETLRVGHSGAVNDVQRSQLGLMYSAALGLVSVSSDIVDLARGSRGLIDGEPEPYSVAEMFRGVEEMVRPMAEEKRIELRVVVSEHEQAHGHPVALGRVILNLTTNALKFTDEGFVEIGVQRRTRTQLEFYVRDTGRGISEDRQKELFQPFKKRIARDGHFFSGSGVGLSIARRLVRSMGSELHLETAPGWGTRFSFLLDTAPLH